MIESGYCVFRFDYEEQGRYVQYSIFFSTDEKDRAIKFLESCRENYPDAIFDLFSIIKN